MLSWGVLMLARPQALCRPPTPAAPSGLTAEGQQAGVGDGCLTQVQHLEHGEVFRQEPQAGVSKLWSRDPLSLDAPPAAPRPLGK